MDSETNVNFNIQFCLSGLSVVGKYIHNAVTYYITSSIKLWFQESLLSY